MLNFFANTHCFEAFGSFHAECTVCLDSIAVSVFVFIFVKQKSDDETRGLVYACPTSSNRVSPLHDPLMKDGSFQLTTFFILSLTITFDTLDWEISTDLQSRLLWYCLVNCFEKTFITTHDYHPHHHESNHQFWWDPMDGGQAPWGVIEQVGSAWLTNQH